MEQKNVQSFLVKYFKQVTPLSLVEIDGDEQLGGVSFFKVFNQNDKQKLLGLTQEWCHWAIEKSNLALEDELRSCCDDFREPEDLQVFLSSGPIACKWYKVSYYAESIRQ